MRRGKAACSSPNVRAAATSAPTRRGPCATATDGGSTARSTSARTWTPRCSSCWPGPTAHPTARPASSTFIVPRLRDDGSPNGFHIQRLKPKLGTRGVPTAEVTLDGAIAWLAEQPAPSGHGVAPTRREATSPSEGRDGGERGISTDDGDGEREPVRGRAHGPRHPSAIVPREPRSTPHTANSGASASTATRWSARRSSTCSSPSKPGSR